MGLAAIFMILPDVSEEAKAASAGQGIQTDGSPPDGAQGKSQNRRSAGVSGRQSVPKPDRNPVREPGGAGREQKSENVGSPGSPANPDHAGREHGKSFAGRGL